MSIKVVVLFQTVTQPSAAVGPLGITLTTTSAPNIGYVARQHIAGWSEYFYFYTDSVIDLLSALRTGFGGLPAYLPARAALLPPSGQIVGVRLYQGGAGKGQSYGFSYPGQAGLEQDFPQSALLCKTGPPGVAVSRRFTLRCIPDDVVQGGEFTPSPGYANAVANYFQALYNFTFRAFDPTAATAGIFNISAAGVITTTIAVQPFLVNQIVTITRTLDGNQLFHKFQGVVTSVGPAQNQFTVSGWTFGACTGGTVSLKSKLHYSMNPSVSAVSRIVVRKVGRPFEQYRGRRSKRRRTA
jgi:hypothetical protein